MPIAASSQPRAAQPDARLFPPARLRERDRERDPAKQGAAAEEPRAAGRLDPPGQAGEAAPAAGLSGRAAAPPAAPFLPSPPPAPAAASPPAPFLLLEPPRTRSRSRSGFLTLAMSGAAAHFQPPPPLHGPSLPEQGARSQGRGSPAGHGHPRAAPAPGSTGASFQCQSIHQDHICNDDSDKMVLSFMLLLVYLFSMGVGEGSIENVPA